MGEPRLQLRRAAPGQQVVRPSAAHLAAPRGAHAERGFWFGLADGAKRLVVRLFLAAATALLLTSAASAACTGSSSTISGASITFTSVGQTVSICITDDHVKWGLYPAANVASNFNGPIGNTTGNIDVPQYSFADYTYTTSNASYLLHPVQGSAFTGADEVQVTLQSQSGGSSNWLQFFIHPRIAPTREIARQGQRRRGRQTAMWTMPVPPTPCSPSPSLCRLCPARP